jgi:hypothetical protein
VTMHEDDLDAVLRRAFPNGHTYLRCEGGLELLNHGARQLLGTPSIARELLGAQGDQGDGARSARPRRTLRGDRNPSRRAGGRQVEPAP